MNDRHNVRKGIAALLSVLSVGGVAGANKKPGTNLSKGQNIVLPKGKKNPRNIVKKENLSKSQSLNPNIKKALEGKTKNQNFAMSDKATAKPSGTFFSHLSGASKELQSAFGSLSPKQRGLLIPGILEVLGVLYDGRGVIERFNNFTLSWLTEALREKIFGDRLTKTLDSKGEMSLDGAVVNSVEVRKKYEIQQSVEELIASKWGPVFGVFAKLSYYLKDSIWDFLAAFWHGCTDNLKDVREGGVDITDGEELFNSGDISSEKFASVGFGNYFDIKTGEVHNWGPRQVLLWWDSVKNMGWKRSALNNWAYNLGAAVFNSQVRKASGLRKKISSNGEDDNSKKELVGLIKNEIAEE